MKRFKRFAAILLSAAMVMTSFQVPVFAETSEEIVVGQDDFGSAADIITGAEAEPKGSAADEIPAEQTPETPAEDVTGADDRIHVYGAADLVSALNGRPEKAEDLSHDDLAADKLGKTDITIVLEGNSGDYKITNAILAVPGTEFKVKEGKNITIVGGDITVSFDEDVKEQPVLKVPKGSSLTLQEGTYQFGMEVEQEGTFKSVDVVIANSKGDSLVNNGKAEFDGGSVTSVSKNSVAVKNNEGAELTIGGNTEVTAQWDEYGYEVKESFTAIENNGTLLINDATVQATGSSVSSCAINNTEKGTLAVRGGQISSSAVAIFNRNSAELGSPLAIDKDDADYYTRLNIRSSGFRYPAVLSVGAAGNVTVYHTGTVIGSGEDQSVPAAATTPVWGKGTSGNGNFTAADDGNITIYGGTVYGIAYDKNLPVYVGGTIWNEEIGACVKYTGKTEGNVTYPEAADGAYAYKDGRNGKELTEKSAGNKENPLPKISPEDEPYVQEWPIVKDVAELKQALELGFPRIQLGENNEEFTVSDNLVINKSVVLLGSDVCIEDGYDASGKKVSSGKITIADGAEVTFDEVTRKSYSFISSTVSGSSIEVQKGGTLNFDRVNMSMGYVYGLSDAEKANITAVQNEGNFVVRNSSSLYFQSGKGVNNTGDFKMYGGSIRHNSNNSGIAVVNDGAFEMHGGSINAYSDNTDSYAVAYKGTNYPVLVKGSVYGARPFGTLSLSYYQNGTDEKGNPVYDYTKGSAVVSLTEEAGKANVYGEGSFYDAVDKKELISSRNARYISDGVAQDRESVNTGIIKEEYILMKQDDVVDITDRVKQMVTASNVSNYFAEVESSNANVVSLSDNKILTNKAEDSDKKIYLKAAGKGYTTVTVRLKDGDSDTAKIIAENYLRIEVAAKEKYDNLTAEDYTGNITTPNLQFNGYWSKDVPVSFEFHLRDSEDSLTGAELEDLIRDTYHVKRIRIDDKEFNDYFELYDIPQYDEQNKQYYFSIAAKRELDSTKLLSDDIKNINDIEVKAVLENDNVDDEKQIVIKLGAFNINVKSAVPKITVKAVTLNRFYNSYSGGNYFDINDAISCTEDDAYIYDDWNDINNDVVCPAGVSYRNGYVTATGKKGGKITAEVSVAGFIKTYPVSIPVKIINKAPKVSVQNKSVAVDKEFASQTDILNYLTTKDKTAALNIDKIEVIGKSSFKAVKGYPYIAGEDKLGIPNSWKYSFFLQPVDKTVNIDKPETVQLKVTWDGTRKVNGKDYSQTLKVKVTQAKAITVKQSGKATLNTTVNGEWKDGTQVYFEVSPKTYRGGAFVVTGLDGRGKEKTALDYLEVGPVNYSGTEGLYYVNIAPNSKTAERGKAAKFAVDLVTVNADGSMTSRLNKPAVMTVSLYSDSTLEVPKKSAVIDMNKVKASDVVKAREQFASKGGDVDDDWDDWNNYIQGRLTASFKVKEKGKWDVTSVDSAEFNAYVSDRTKAIVAYPKQNAFYAGKIQAGRTYKFDVVLQNEAGVTQKETLEITTKAAKKPEVQLMDDSWNGKKSFEMYMKSPYTLDSFWLTDGNRRSFNDNWGDNAGKAFSAAPYYGLTVKEIKVADESSPYEIIKYKSANGNQPDYYALAFKGRKAPKVSDAKAFKAYETVSIVVTYTNGVEEITGKVEKFKVNIADKDVILKSLTR